MTGALSPAAAGGLADAILALHVGVVAFVVLGMLAILAGGPLGWAWVRRPVFRIAHLALMLLIAAQAWLGALCPLTVWEQALRTRAGQATYSESFIQHWLSRLIFFDAPWWFFVAGYSAFAALAALCWLRWPPRRGARSPRPPCPGSKKTGFFCVFLLAATHSCPTFPLPT
ncbi:DUF2784 domain-containing protein [Luteimonas aquatica]|uniref:DUF2784 domain-containing protein n=1 Tax=Luteimonas aquatica TaxID=450364 RepID=UPI001F59AFAA|nr:DUF2784 domain-containing protein [Luteimonas aquatica]